MGYQLRLRRRRRIAKLPWLLVLLQLRRRIAKLNWRRTRPRLLRTVRLEKMMTMMIILMMMRNRLRNAADGANLALFHAISAVLSLRKNTFWVRTVFF